MSLAIDTDTVTHVLLADGWHHVSDRSFDIDSYEFLWSGINGMTVAEFYKAPKNGRDWDTTDPLIVHGGGSSGICAAGFDFKTGDGTRIAGPLSAVLAVRYLERDSRATGADVHVYRFRRRNKLADVLPRAAEIMRAGGSTEDVSQRLMVSLRSAQRYVARARTDGLLV